MPFSFFSKKSKAKAKEAPAKADVVEENHTDLSEFQEQPKKKIRVDAFPQGSSASASSSSSAASPTTALSLVKEEKYDEIPAREMRKSKETRPISWASGMGGSAPVDLVKPEADKTNADEQQTKQKGNITAKDEQEKLAELKAREEEERAKLQKEAEKSNAEAQSKACEEADQKAKAEAETKSKEEVEQLAKAQADQKAKAEAESKAKEEAKEVGRTKEDRHSDLPNLESPKDKKRMGSATSELQPTMQTLQLTYIGSSELLEIETPVLPSKEINHGNEERHTELPAGERVAKENNEEHHTELPAKEKPALPSTTREEIHADLPIAERFAPKEATYSREEKHRELPGLERPKGKAQRSGYANLGGPEQKHTELPSSEIQKPKERPRSAEPKAARISLGCEKQLPVARRPRRRNRRSVHPTAEPSPHQTGPRPPARRIYLRPRHLAPAMSPEANLELDMQWTASKKQLLQRYAETLEPRPLTFKERYGDHLEVGINEELKPVRLVQRYDATTGEPIGDCWLARNVVPLPPQMQMDDDVTEHLQDDEGRQPGTAEEVGPWRCLRYSDSRVASEELQFKYDPEGSSKVMVDAVAPGSFAQRMGVAPGFHLVGINEDKIDFHSHLQELTSLKMHEYRMVLHLSTADGPCSLEFIDPLSGGHGVRSRGDIMARQSPPQPLIARVLPSPPPIPGCVY
eukprot:gnl/MRDRNA2_/MRDRNA2_96004_c0_seq1.p1 gnl/MRDRNA2_/MRDRNA2_96004_c0~~gnl/MRDRNA2_/MRDRNA2_96004_c0_seq1.p1  ORF type:complete len:691 (-),score=182.61 gnl/MRDRNA2_/MRDRNA2_96004_c0_seq1:84-2156(-)